MESTGACHLPLYSALSKIFKTNIYQPKQVKDRSNKNIRKSKTDKRDARTLSRIHLEISPPQTDYSDKEMYDVREIIRLRFKYKDIRTNLKKIYGFLKNVWDKVKKLHKPETETKINNCCPMQKGL